MYHWLFFCVFSVTSHIPELALFQAKLIDVTLLTPEEVRWVDEYHENVWDKVSSRVSGRTKEWLRTNTLPLITQVFL
jgi:hypothetical protein